MEKLLGIELLEGVTIEYCDGENIYMCNDAYSFVTPFPIKFLDSLLRIIIINKEPLKSFSELLCLGYEQRHNKYWRELENINLKIDDNFTILSIAKDLDIIYTYDGKENKFPIRWLSEELREKLNYSQLREDKAVRVHEEFLESKKNGIEKALDKLKSIFGT